MILTELGMIFGNLKKTLMFFFFYLCRHFNPSTTRFCRWIFKFGDETFSDDSQYHDRHMTWFFYVVIELINFPHRSIIFFFFKKSFVHDFFYRWFAKMISLKVIFLIAFGMFTHTVAYCTLICCFWLLQLQSLWLSVALQMMRSADCMFIHVLFETFFLFLKCMNGQGAST